MVKHLWLMIKPLLFDHDQLLLARIKSLLWMVKHEKKHVEPVFHGETTISFHVSNGALRWPVSSTHGRVHLATVLGGGSKKNHLPLENHGKTTGKWWCHGI